MVLVGDNFSGQADANPSKVLGDVVAMVACCVARVLAVPGDRAVRVASQVAVLGLPDCDAVFFQVGEELLVHC